LQAQNHSFLTHPLDCDIADIAEMGGSSDQAMGIKGISFFSRVLG